MAPHSSTLAWKIPWTEEPGRLKTMGSWRVGQDWATSLSLFTFMHWRRKWKPTPVFLPGESQDGGAWWASVYGVAQSWTRLKRLSSSSSSKGNQSWIFIGRTDEASVLWPPDAKNWLIGKDPHAGKDWRQEEKGMTEDEMVGWHHQLNGHEFEWTPRVGDVQGSLACCSPWGCRVGHNWATELNRTELINFLKKINRKPLRSRTRKRVLRLDNKRKKRETEFHSN